MFRTVPLSIIRRFSLNTQQTCDDTPVDCRNIQEDLDVHYRRSKNFKSRNLTLLTPRDFRKEIKVTQMVKFASFINVFTSSRLCTQI